jgi:hypothetical protein
MYCSVRNLAGSAVDVPEEGGLQIFGGTVLLFVECCLENAIIAELLNPAEHLGKPDSLAVVKIDLAEGDDAALFEKAAKFRDRRPVQQGIEVGLDLGADAGSQIDRCELHPSPSVFR